MILVVVHTFGVDVWDDKKVVFFTDQLDGEMHVYDRAAIAEVRESLRPLNEPEITRVGDEEIVGYRMARLAKPVTRYAKGHWLSLERVGEKQDARELVAAMQVERAGTMARWM